MERCRRPSPGPSRWYRGRGCPYFAAAGATARQAGFLASLIRLGPNPCMTCPSLQLEEPGIFCPRCFRQSRIHLPLPITMSWAPVSLCRRRRKDQ